MVPHHLSNRRCFEIHAGGLKGLRLVSASTHRISSFPLKLARLQPEPFVMLSWLGDERERVKQVDEGGQQFRDLRSVLSLFGEGTDAAQIVSDAASRAEGHSGSRPEATGHGAGSQRLPLPRPPSGLLSAVPLDPSLDRRLSPACATSPLSWG